MNNDFKEFFKELFVIDRESKRKHMINKELVKAKKEDSTIIDDEGNELMFEPLWDNSDFVKLLKIDGNVDISKELELLNMKPRKKKIKKTGWISTAKSLPDTDDPVIIRITDGRYVIGNYGYLLGIPVGGKCWFSLNDGLTTFENTDVTHWMVIPELPK